MRKGWGWLCLLILWACPVSAEPIRIAGTGSALAAFSHLADLYRQSHPQAQFDILPSLGSKGGIRALLANRVDVAISVSPVSSDFAQAPIQTTPWTRSPFALFVAEKNPLTDLSRATLLAIYTGTQTHWADGTPIRPILRPAEDSSTKIMRSMTPGMDAALTKADQMWGGAAMITDQETATALETIPGAIGGLVVGQVRAEKRRLRPLSLDGQLPDVQHLHSGDYPYSIHYTLITRQDQTGAVADFMTFIQSKPAFDAARAMGFIP